MYSSDEVFTDPHIISRGMVVEVDDPKGGKVKHIGVPFKLSDTPGRVRSVAPEIGQHTESIITEMLNYTEEDLARFQEQHVI